MRIHELGDGMGDRALLQRLHVLLRVARADRRPAGRLHPEESPRRPTREEDAVHVIVALDRGRLVGGSISSYLAVLNAGLVEALAVDGRRRAPGLHHVLLDRTVRLLRADAGRTGRELDWIGVDDSVPRRPDLLRGAGRPGIRERWGHHLIDLPTSPGAPAGGRPAVRGPVPRAGDAAPAGDVLPLHTDVPALTSGGSAESPAPSRLARVRPGGG